MVFGVNRLKIKKIRVYKYRSPTATRVWRVEVHGVDKYFCDYWREAWRYAEHEIEAQIRVAETMLRFGKNPTSYIENGPRYFQESRDWLSEYVGGRSYKN